MNNGTITPMVENRLALNWIRVARVGWLLVILFVLTLFILGLPHRHSQLAVPCDRPTCPVLSISSTDAALIDATSFSLQGYASFHIGLEIFIASIMSAAATLIFWKYFDNLMGILTAYLLAYIGLSGFVQSAYAFAVQHPPLELLYNRLFAFFPALILLLIYTFPNGRFVNNLSRAAFVTSLFINIIDGIIRRDFTPDPSNLIGTAMFIGVLAVGIWSQIHRYRNFSTVTEKQQTKWVLLGFAGLVLCIGAWGLLIESSPSSTPQGLLLTNTLGLIIIYLFACIFPVSLMIAIVRYRLWNIDIIINRTLVYGGLTLMITAVYILLVGGVGTLAANQSGRIIGFILATIIVAFRVRPLQRWLQTAVNRFAPITAPPDHIKQRNEQRANIPPRPVPRWLTAGLLLITLIGPLATGLLTLAGCDPLAINDGELRMPLSLFSGPAFAILGGLIFVYRPHNRIGWLCLWLSFSLPASSALDLYATCGASGTISAPGMSYVAWFLYSYGVMVLFPLMFLLPMVYPTGRFLSPRWRRTAVAGLIVYALIGTAVGLVPDFSQGNLFYRYPLTNPFGLQQLPDWWFSLFYALLHLGFVAFNLAGAAAMVVRFRRSVGDERLQMKWLAYFLTTALGIQMLFFNLPGAFFYPQIFETVWFDMILWLIFLGFPLVIGIAIFKYRLYAIDVVINRTLVYGGLTLTVVLIYALVVGGLGLLFQDSGNFVISLIATGLIAVAFNPVRNRLQRGVNRLMFGQRDNPYAVLSTLGQQLQTTAVPSETLNSLVQTMADTLKLPYVAIELIEDGQRSQAGRGWRVHRSNVRTTPALPKGNGRLSHRFPALSGRTVHQSGTAAFQVDCGTNWPRRLRHPTNQRPAACPRAAGAHPRRRASPHSARPARWAGSHHGQPNLAAGGGARHAAGESAACL